MTHDSPPIVEAYPAMPNDAIDLTVTERTGQGGECWYTATSVGRPLLEIDVPRSALVPLEP